MIPKGNVVDNIERFTGFEKDYDRFRPEAPQLVVEILTQYLGNKPTYVVDLGCGTGLSTFIWNGYAEHVVGIEPNDDMRSRANEKLTEQFHMKLDSSPITFVKGYSNATTLEANSADIVTCSQSFHWMEPSSTLSEIDRILRDGGIFAAYDCDWPPTIHPSIETSYINLMKQVDELLSLHRSDTQAQKWNKDEHLARIKSSKRFRFTKEIVFHNKEQCDANRYIGLALSQGGLQSVVKLGLRELDQPLEVFQRSVEEYFQGQAHEILFSYRMRLGVK